MGHKKRKLLLLIPALSVIAITSTYPLIYAFWLGSHKWLISQSPKMQEFVGLENFIRAMTDSNFFMVAKTSFLYTFISVSLSVVIGLAIAIVLQRPGMLSTLTKTLLIFPFAISPALKGYTFRYLLHPESGVLDRFFNFLFPFTENLIWLGDTGWALYWLAMTEVWGWAPLVASCSSGLWDRSAVPVRSGKARWHEQHPAVLLCHASHAAPGRHDDHPA